MKGYYKCYWCKEYVKKEESVTYSHTPNQHTYILKGHESCLERWKNEYVQFKLLEKTLLEVLEIKILTKSMITRLRDMKNGDFWIVKRVKDKQLDEEYLEKTLEKRRGYEFRIIEKTIKENKHIIKSHLDKGWNYIARIIENKIGDVYRKDQDNLHTNLGINDAVLNIEFKKETTKKTKKKVDITSLLD